MCYLCIFAVDWWHMGLHQKGNTGPQNRCHSAHCCKHQTARPCTWYPCHMQGGGRQDIVGLLLEYILLNCISGQRISFILPIPSGRLRPGGVVVPVTITPLSIPAMAYLSSVNETKIDSNFIYAAYNFWYSYSCALVWLQHLQSWWAMNNSVLWPLKDIGTIYVMFMRHDSWSWIRVAIFSSPLCPLFTWPCINHYNTTNWRRPHRLNDIFYPLWHI